MSLFLGMFTATPSLLDKSPTEPISIYGSYQSPYGLSQSSSGSLPPRQEHTEAKQGGKRPKSSRPNRWKRPDKTGRSAGHSANQAASDQSNKQVTDSPSTSLIE